MTKKRFSTFMISSLVIYVVIRLIVGDVYTLNKTGDADEKKKNQSTTQTENTTSLLVSSDSTDAQTENSIQGLQKSDEEFKSWVQIQSRNLEIPTKDPIDFETKTKEFVNQLNPSQLAALKDKILNVELPMNERIFSNYALIQFQCDTKNEVLRDLLNAPVPMFQDPKPHSEDEVRRGQEYALRYMEIDELFHRTEDGDEQAREFFVQIAQNHSDSKIQNYAKRKLKEIRK